MAAWRRTAVLSASVLAVLPGLTGCGSDPSNPQPAPPAAHHTTTVVSPPAPTRPAAARRLLASPRARLGALAVTPGRPDRRIAEWYTCRDARCLHRTYALVVTADGFRTSHVVAVGTSHVANGWYLETAGPEHFAISPNGGRRSLVHLAGHVTRTHVSGAAGPLRGAEVPLRSAKAGFVAVDPATGQGHPLSTPPQAVEVHRTPAGQLRALSYDTGRYWWSADGGARWHAIPIPHRGAGTAEGYVPTPSDSQHVVLLGGDGATLFPWDRVLTSTRGGPWTSYDGPRHPTAYVDTTVVLPDGRLLLDVIAWSDQRAGRPAVRPVGFYAGRDWSALRPVPMGAPFDVSPHRSFLTVLDVVLTRHSATIYAQALDPGRVFATTDGGVTWRPERAR